VGVPWSRQSDTSRIVLASGVVAALSVLLFVLNAIHPVVPWPLLWLGNPIAAVLVAVSFWRTSRAGHLPEPTRRFWGRLLPAGILIGLGGVCEAVTVLTLDDPAGPHVSLGQLIFDGPAILLVIYALLRLPIGRQTRGDLFRVVLDAGTVMLACTVFLWHFQTRNAVDHGDRTTVYLSLGLTVLGMLVTATMAKFMMTSHHYLDRGALRLIGIATLIGVVLPTLRPVIELADPHLFPDMISMPLVMFFASWAAERQRAADYGPRRGVKPAERRPFSYLPYAAVGAVDALLLAVTWADADTDLKVVVVSAVLLTGLVVLRQVTAFLDNGRLLRRLDHGATHDGLTQLPNRVLFHERLQRALTTPGERPVAVALIDLDDFKEVNDTLGHEVGDLLLIAVAQRLNGSIRAEDTVARLGGDEFVVVLDGADPQAADLAAQRMVEALRSPVLADGHELPIRASIGIADGRSGDDPSVLLRRADIAMYAAKNIPGTASLHYENSMASAGLDHAHLGAELREAIGQDQLFLVYQPIVALDDRRVVGAEALVRWAHPRHGTLAPDDFLPVAERTGLIVPLDRWVLRAALAQVSAWPDPIALSINISARDLREPGFAAAVADLLAEFGVDADRITLEVTESMAIEPGDALTAVADLRAQGIRVALDDFGTGNSTLTLLHDCPVDELKLDRSFTQAGADDRVPMAAAVLHLANALGLAAVAEGVETPEQLTLLADLGYESAQGFYFARPMPPERFQALLTEPGPLVSTS
jgi:diguanylate cyclase